MVHPEIDEHLLELPLAVDRADQLRGLHPLDHAPAAVVAGEHAVDERIRIEAGEAGLHRVVGDLLRVELGLDPRLNAGAADRGEVRGARAISEAVQGVDEDGVIGGGGLTESRGREGEGEGEWRAPETASREVGQGAVGQG